MMFSDGFQMLDTDPGATITLTPGTDSIPVENFVYIPQSTKVLTVSTTGFPSTEHIPVAKVVLRSAATTGTEGALKNQNVNNHIQSTTSNLGHHVHIGDRIRKFDAAWESGTEGSITGNPSNLYIGVTSGEVYQMHKQTFPAQQMPTDDCHIVNDPVTPYKTVSDLGTITVDSEGNSLNNKYFSIVIWGAANKSGEGSHIFCNLPSGGYTVSEEQAIADANGYTNYTIPADFKGVAFLIGRYTMRLSGAGFTYSASTGYQDLRGFTPNTSAGSVTGASGVSTFLGLTDTPVSYVGEAGKVLRVNAGETATEFSGVTIDASDNMTVPGTLDVTGSITMVSDYFTGGTADGFYIDNAENNRFIQINGGGSDIYGGTGALMVLGGENWSAGYAGRITLQSGGWPVFDWDEVNGTGTFYTGIGAPKTQVLLLDASQNATLRSYC
jgi:hypothetical protein